MTAFSIAFLTISALLEAQPRITVVYPRPALGDPAIHIDRVDSNFIFGAVQPPEARLEINGFPVALYDNGAYLAFLPVDWKSCNYCLTAWVGGDTARMTVHFGARPIPEPPDRPDVSFPLKLALISSIARTDPSGAYYLFPDSGTVAQADDWKAGYYRIPIGRGRSVWVAQESVKPVSKDEKSTPPILYKGAVLSQSGRDVLRLPLGRKTLFRVWDETDPSRITLEFFGVISHLDRIQYAPDRQQIQEVIWDQPEDRVLRLQVNLAEPSWGYAAYWDTTDFCLAIKPKPKLDRGLQHLCIAVDAGHGGEQFGAIGPTGLMEKDVNLEVAIALVEHLQRKGARVVLTRTADVTLSLSDRIAIAVRAGADLLISLHHNALPDGVNPFTDLGTGVRFYRPQSWELAQDVQAAMVEELGFFDEGIYYDNLALVRPTQMPAVLIEAAYIMLPEQEQTISAPGYPDRLAKAVCEGIISFIDSKRKE